MTISGVVIRPEYMWKRRARCLKTAHRPGMWIKISDESRAHAQPAGELMTMAKPKTELGQRCPPPPYTRWDQRGKPVLLSYLKLIHGKQLCLSLETDDPDVAKRHMRLLVPMLLAKGRLSPDGKAAEVYGRKGTSSPRLDKFKTEVRQLKALSEAEYGSEALATAKRWGRPVGIIHHLVGRKPVLNAGAYRNRRTRARQHGQKIAKANFWYHRPPRGKGFYKNGRVMTARIQLARSATTWSLKFRDDAARAAKIMNPVRVAWDHVYEAAKQELNWGIGTAEHTAAVAARVEACGRLAREIHEAGGPKELVAFVMTPPQPQAGTASAAIVHRVPPTDRRAMKEAALKNCREWLIKSIQAYPDRAPGGLVVFVKEAKLKFGVAREDFRNCLAQAEKETNGNWSKHGRPRN
jgi:hypothetical protein